MKCIVCNKIMKDKAAMLQTCPICLETVVYQQGILINEMKDQIYELMESHDKGKAQATTLLSELKIRTSSEEYSYILNKLLKNPYNLGDIDLC